jgi:hypothetical protein
MITKVEEDDGGSYNCSGVINGQKEYDSFASFA